MKTAVPAMLEEFAAHLRVLCEAEGTAVLLHLEPLKRDNLMLTAAGQRFAPEFRNSDAAWSFLSAQRDDPDTGDDDAVRQVLSQDGESRLICVPLARILPRPGQAEAQVDERRAYPVVYSAPRLDGNIWIATTGGEATYELSRLFNEMDDTGSEERRLARFVSLAARLAWQVYHLNRSLQDPVSRLPGRKEFDTFLTRALVAASNNGQPLGLLLINPDDFVMVNHRFGRDQGDLAVREVASRLLEYVRKTDGVFRYGGAMFGVILPATDLESTQIAATKYRQLLANEPYLGGRLDLKFTIGGAVADLDYLAGSSLEQLDMVQRADNALNQAKLAGGGRIVLSAMSDPAEGLNHFDPLSGIFTADSEKDYRNMLLLWEAVSLVSSTPDPQQLAKEFVDRLGSRFHPDRVALVRESTDFGDERLEVLATSVRSDSSRNGRELGRAVRFGRDQIALIRRALESGKAERGRQGEADSPSGCTSYAVPLAIEEQAIGCLFLDGINRRLQLDSTDLMFLNALASQLAIALDRAELSANWIQEKDQESRRLRERVRELQQAITPKEPVFESQQMTELMALIRRVAPSDATVLIAGESGTGKEMLAHSVHQYSTRCDRPFVTVDCGAIAHSLLEAELFGHVKGAFTGAESASEGRIAQADGGTLFLDEIGELPLEVQSKLLRFVQEREFTPVGGNQTRRVDVRIVAATNRELKDEVAMGRFRQDLYYRLQVISIQALPLRNRPDDIIPLARAFLARFAAQNQRRCSSFSAEAEQILKAHSWPGNVRELQHTILRALLMCDTEIVGSDAIDLLPESGSAGPTVHKDHSSEIQPPAIDGALSTTAPLPHRTAEADSEPGQDSERPTAADSLAALRSELAWQVAQALADNANRPVPIGRWLQDDLVLAVSQACGEVVRRAARFAGVPESTFRRQLDKARVEADSGLAARTEAWSRMKSFLSDMVSQTAEEDGNELLEEARKTLLDIVVDRVESKNTVGAALMGVSPPTFKRWTQDRAA